MKQIVMSNSQFDHTNKQKKNFILQNALVEVSTVIENCSCDLYLDLVQSIGTPISTLNIGKFQLNVLEGLLEHKTCRFELLITDIYIYMNVEDIIPTKSCLLPCQLQDDQPACLPSSEQHAWGRLFELGNISANGNIDSSTFNCKSEIIFVSFEWSLAMGKSVTHVVRMMGLEKNISVSNTKRDVSEDGKCKQLFDVNMELEVKNINIFLLGDKEGGYNSLLCKLDNVSSTMVSAKEPFLTRTDGMVITQLTELTHLKTGDTFYCHASKTFINNLLMVPSTSTAVNINNKTIDVGIEQVNIEWNANLHMALYEQIVDAELFKQTIEEIFPPVQYAVRKKPSKDNPFVFKLKVNNFSLKMATSVQNSFWIEAKAICLNTQPVKIMASDISMLFDEKEIFKLEDVEVNEQTEDASVEVRKQWKSIASTNSTWEISIYSFYASFPYQFNFGESIEHLQLVIKMLKYLHKKPKTASYVEPLPPDLLISCENIMIELEDDPFEVRFGDNYILLADEIEQAIEREEKLDAKLDEIQSQKGALLSGRKLDELRRNLKEKNSQIYIERSKEMHEDRPAHKPLFLIILKGLNLEIVADESIHGLQNVVEQMKVVDPDSPFPDDIQFTTLWCRMIIGQFKFLKMLIRDYPQPFVSMEMFTTRGLVMGSEACGVEKATGEGVIKTGYPWKDLTVIKNMPALKFYYDQKWDMSVCQVAWGANFEPTFAMISQSFELLSKASIDPSVPLPYWDKIRLLFHGNLKADIADFNILLSTSVDPYNTTEKLEIEWTAVTLEWTNGNINIDGDFDMFTRTASKYDDSKVLHFPAFKFMVQLQWLCEGDSNDHHDVYPTNPKYVSSEDHDSYALFRSTNYNMNVSIETSTEQSAEQLKLDPPSVFLYASTFRWFQTYQAVVINRVSRPIKCGVLFKNTKPKKTTLGRHLKLVGIDFKFPHLNATYWGSFQQEIGFETIIAAGSLSVSYQVFISHHPDGIRLIRRPIANWIIRGLNSTMEQVRLFLLQSVEKKLENAGDGDDELCIDDEGTVKKHYLFSVNKVDYKRQSIIVEDSFTHKILMHNFKGAWTAINRELSLGLFEAYSKMQMLKKVLSSEALKSAADVITTEAKREKSGSSSFLDISASKSPLTRLQSGHGVSLLQQLVSEQSSKFIAQSEEGEVSDYDFEFASEDDEQDIIQRNWHIEFVNSQVLLHGTETKGAIIVTSANAAILKRLHCPICATGDVVTTQNKVTWYGTFRNLQYFSTVENFKDITVDNIPWLTDMIIVGEATEDEPDPQDSSALTKNRDAVSAFVEVSVEGVIHQLQRVISRCRCEFHYVSLDDELDPVAEEYIPSTPQTSTSAGLGKTVVFANSLDLKHGKFKMSTSTSQYNVIVDICQNLIFYTAPKKKEEQERLEKMKFKLQLSTGQDLKGYVSQLQTRVRSTQLLLRRYERRLFECKKKEEEILTSDSMELLDEVQEIILDLQEQIEVTKDQLFADCEDLKILINAYKDVQLMNFSPKKGLTSIRKEIVVLFDDMQWLLTQQDGHFSVANVFIEKFKYNQLAFRDNCTEHSFEIGSFAVKNLLPNAVYREALIPHEVNIRRRLDKHTNLRIFCRMSPAIAGIMVKDHFEINVCPIAVRLTHKLFVNLESFFFPKNIPVVENMEQNIEVQLGARSSIHKDLRSEKLSDGGDDTKDGSTEVSTIKVPPPRPPPPRPPPPSRASTRRINSASSNSEIEILSTSKAKKPPHIAIASDTIGSPLPQSPLNSVPATPKSANSLKRGMSFKTTSFASADRDVNTMKERAARNQTFIYIKIPEVPVCFSYKGEKDRNIEDAHDFNLCLPTLEYHSRTWTWQDLFQSMKKDYIQVLVPQILKEKLHLKSSGADTKPSIAKVDDTNKAKLLFGEKQTQKKSAKKMLFGKLLKNKLPSSEQSNDQTGLNGSTESEQQTLMGKGVEPSNLEEAFKKLRDLGSEKDNLS